MISDHVLTHLQNVIDEPDLSATPYKLKARIGSGGMGTVYLAHDDRLNRDVALKITENAREAQTLGSLEHPGIVPVHDVGALPDGRAYCVMKFVQGTRFDDYLSKPSELNDRLRLYLDICDAAAFAHSRGVIHRDLKPQNVMIGSFGEVLILDWGAAENLTSSGGTVAGTAGYFAPEQYSGITNERTDIYTLGKLLEGVLAPSGPKRLRAVATKAANKSADLRYPTVQDLAADVRRFLNNQPVQAYRESPVERASRLLSANRTLAALIFTYLIVRVVIFFFARH